jgi:hypothetical protein
MAGLPISNQYSFGQADYPINMENGI